MTTRHKFKILFFLTGLLFSSCDFMNYKNKPEDMSDQNVNEWNEAYNSYLIPSEAFKTRFASSSRRRLAAIRYAACAPGRRTDIRQLSASFGSEHPTYLKKWNKEHLARQNSDHIKNKLSGRRDWFSHES